MGLIEDIFGMDDKKRITTKEFNERLGEIPELTQKERAYLDVFFEHELKNGLTTGEVKERIYKLAHNYQDNITPHEVEELRRKLIGELESK